MTITTRINLASLDGNNGFRLDGEAAEDFLGRSVSSAGDVNGDGFDDVIVGADGADPSGHFSGSSYVVFGKASGFSATMELSSLDGSNGFRLDGVKTHDFSGTSVSVAGDVNGDGFDDVIVGAIGADPNGDYSGSSYVVFGKASGFSATMNLSILDGSNGFRLDGVTLYDQSGSSVSNAGDVNGDGFDDVIIGADKADPNGNSSGSSFLVFGKASGFSATMDLSSLDGSNGFRLNGEARYDYSGFPVSTAGDVNGDGFDDLIVGAPVSYSGSNRLSSSYVVFGKASGFSATMELSSLNGSNGFHMNGESAIGWTGASVSDAGDVNGDGFGDLIVGVQRSNSNDRYSGFSYVVFGKASGFSASLDLSSLDGSNGFRLNGEAELDHSGISVSTAGDVNGDGFDDVIVGALGADPNGDYSGSSYVVFGKASGFSATIELSSLDGDNGFRLDGWDERDYLGSSVSTAGDVNRDGFDDLIVGAFGADRNGEDFGSSYIMFGRSDFGRDADYQGTAGNDELMGTKAAEGFEAGAGNDKMIGNGGADVFYGEAGDDYIRVADLNFQLVDGGAGRDTLELGGGGLNLDLASVRGRVSDIETIYLYGTGDNTLTLSVLDVLNLSDETNTLRIKGNAGDSVAGLASGWVDGGIQGDFHVYVQYQAVLQIDVAVSTDFINDNVISLSSLDGNNGFRLDGAEYDFSGASVSTAGDVNGDGFDDVIVGASGADPNGYSSGSIYVVFGKTSGFDATMNLSDLDGSNGFRLDGGAENDFLNGSVSNAGDVNGDGFDDVIVGASGADPSGSSSGSSYVVFGKTSGFDAAMNLSDLDGSNGFRLDGETAHDRSGWSVSNAGDVNGDGFDDLIVGAYGADPNGLSSGSSYVVFGKTSRFDAEINLSDLDGNNGFRIDGKATYDQSGFSVNNAGDVNGDGFDDLIIGTHDSGFSNYNYSYGAGFSYVILGKATGFDATLNFIDLDGESGFRLDGETAYDLSGWSVSTAGDVNGDGFDDLIVGAIGATPNGMESGSSYIIFGRSDFGRDVDFPGTAGDDELTGTKAAERFEAGAGNDKMIGRGGADEFYGEVGHDYIRVSDLNFQWVDGGAGRDTLGLGGKGLNLDLASVNGRISDIETIYLYGTGDNTLTLTALDVVNLSSTSNVLRVNGNEGDHIVGLSNGWDDGGIHGKFHTYTQGEAVLLVGVNVATDFV